MTDPLTCQSCGAPLSVVDQGSTVVRCTYCGTDHTVAVPSGVPTADYSRQFTAALFRAISHHFTEAELKDLVIRALDQRST